MSDASSTPAETAKQEAARQAVALVFLLVSAAVVMAVQHPDLLRTCRKIGRASCRERV